MTWWSRPDTRRLSDGAYVGEAAESEWAASAVGCPVGASTAGQLPLLAHRCGPRQRHGHTLTIGGYCITGGIHRTIATTTDKLRHVAVGVPHLAITGRNADNTSRRIRYDDRLRHAPDREPSVRMVDDSLVAAHLSRTSCPGKERTVTVNADGRSTCPLPRSDELTCAYATKAPVIPKLRARVRFPSSAPRQSPRPIAWGLFVVQTDSKPPRPLAHHMRRSFGAIEQAMKRLWNRHVLRGRLARRHRPTGGGQPGSAAAGVAGPAAAGTYPCPRPPHHRRADARGLTPPRSPATWPCCAGPACSPPGLAAPASTTHSVSPPPRSRTRTARQRERTDAAYRAMRGGGPPPSRAAAPHPHPGGRYAPTPAPMCALSRPDAEPAPGMPRQRVGRAGAGTRERMRPARPGSPIRRG